jgi:hypothetical protein
MVLARHGLNPEEQTRADSEAVRVLLSDKDDGPALPDPWTFFQQILGWRAAQVGGATGGTALPPKLSVRIEESETELIPHWAVVDPDDGWQILVRIEAPGVKPEARGSLEGWEATPHHRRNFALHPGAAGKFLCLRILRPTHDFGRDAQIIELIIYHASN